ncbi:MAG: acyl carrier protein [Burkholderiales bacterium]|nr:acyl carrier protein [Burkholderiales bacterium]
MDSIDSLKQLIHQQFGVEPSAIDPDAPFAQYDLDSLTLAELMFAIEDSFHVEVPDSAVSSVTNLRELAALLDGLRATGNA